MIDRYTMFRLPSQKLVVSILGIWLLGSFIIALIATDMIVIRMAFGVVVFWIGVCGGLMYRYREVLRICIERIPLGWKAKFVLSATALALLEELITTTITNTAPLFGGVIGQDYITASTNYFDVVLFHSVIVFVPFFISFAYTLAKYDLSPFAVFLLFGILGTILEVTYGGPSELLNFVFWIFVYGLMMYIPAYALPSDRGAMKPCLWQYPIVLVRTILIALPGVVAVVYGITAVLKHPDIHF